MSTRSLPSWGELYRSQPVETMPWYLAALDPDVEQAVRGAPPGRLLDLGCGAGTQALALAALGHDVTGTDVADGAIQAAREAAKQRGLKAHFVRDDVLDSKLAGPFDLVLDRGCFHVFEPAQRASYVATVGKLLRPGGQLILKCFSDEQPGDQGPHRFSPAQLREVFEPTFSAESIARTEFQGTLSPRPRALISVLTRR